MQILLEIISIAGFSMAFIVGIVFFNVGKAPQYYLGIFFLAIGFLLFEEYLWLSENITILPHLAELFQAFVFLIPPYLYFYTIYHSEQKNPKIIALHLMPACLSLINFCPLYFESLAFKECYIYEEMFDSVKQTCISFYNDNDAIFIDEDIFDLILIGQFIFYSIIVFQNWNSIAEKKSKKTIAIFKQWAKLLVFLFILALVFILLDIYVFNTSKGVFTSLYISAIVFSLVYFVMSQSILLKDNFQSMVYDKLLPNEINAIYDKTLDLLNQKYNYTNQNLTLKDIAKSLSIPANELSFVLSKKQTNFRNLLNNVRMEKTIEMLNDQNIDHFSIDGIGQLVGYKSKTTFYKYFKEKTGKTPKEYINDQTK